MPTKKNKPSLLIAGPGSGKTTEMVSKIIAVLPNLERHRCLATITYTNSATNTIHKRLKEKVIIPSNVYVSTIHHFLNQFIVLPYATLFNLAGLDKLFMGLNIEEIAEKLTAKSRRKINYYAEKNKIRGVILKGLLREGKIPLNHISNLAAELMEAKCVREAVSLRLQYLFIDEFQDVESGQFHVFENIRRVNRTVIYAVGDPEQYIMGYTHRGRQRPSYSKLPINTWDADRSQKIENYRASDELVKFTNQFHGQIRQISKRGSCVNSSVNFIDSTNLERIVKQYQMYCSKIEQQYPDKHFQFFYLSYENKTFENVGVNFGLIPLISDQQGYRTSLEISIELICSITGKTKNQLLDCYRLDELQVRKLGVQIIDAIHDGTMSTLELLKKHLAGSGIELDSGIDFDKDQNLFKGLCNTVCGKQLSKNYHTFASIHKAKGLEADGVLAVAENADQLNKWLITDPTKRRMDGRDMCRIGYVAFTRAKQFLWIACLEKVDGVKLSELKGLGVVILTEEQQKEDQSIAIQLSLL